MILSAFNSPATLAQGLGGSGELLATYTSAANDTATTMTLTGQKTINATNYSAIIITGNLTATANAACTVKINNDSTANNYTLGQRATGTAVANISSTGAASIQIASSTIANTTNFSFYTVLNLDGGGTFVKGYCISASSLGVETTVVINANSQIPVTSLVFGLPTIAVNGNISAYGVRRA